MRRHGIESVGKRALDGSGKHPVNKTDEDSFARTVSLRDSSHSGARVTASPESIFVGCGYGFRACALRRIPE
jgi:hypothetical protein